MDRSHRTLAELEGGLDEVRRSPTVEGRVERIVRRPAVGTREAMRTATISAESGLDGDDWLARGSRRMEDGSADREAQLTIMNSRFARLVAGEPSSWDAAGDQLYADLDLSEANLPPGTRLAVGTAVVEISAIPHTGCVKFSGRFGPDALRMVSSPAGRALRLRGVNTRVITPGGVRVGDIIRRL